MCGLAVGTELKMCLSIKGEKNKTNYFIIKKYNFMVFSTVNKKNKYRNKFYTKNFISKNIFWKHFKYLYLSHGLFVCFAKQLADDFLFIFLTE